MRWAPCFCGLTCTTTRFALAVLSVDIDHYERIWIFISAGVLIALMVSLLYSVYVADIRLAVNAGQVNPDRITQEPPFDQLGVQEVEPGHYTVTMLARAWAFEPYEVRVPAGALITFRLTSADVIHGFRVPHTTLNHMIIPGQMAVFHYRFRDPGTYSIFCHEYCGIGHHIMEGRIVVEPQPSRS